MQKNFYRIDINTRVPGINIKICSGFGVMFPSEVKLFCKKYLVSFIQYIYHPKWPAKGIIESNSLLGSQFRMVPFNLLAKINAL